jgi:hypothetical protein
MIVESGRPCGGPAVATAVRGLPRRAGMRMYH